MHTYIYTYIHVYMYIHIYIYNFFGALWVQCFLGPSVLNRVKQYVIIRLGTLC